jgi:NitT/TauT family transport system substrate-binding protein
MLKKYQGCVNAGRSKPLAQWRSVCRGVAVAFLFIGSLTSDASAESEPKNVRIAIQFGIGYLPIIVAKQRGLFENQFHDAGLADSQVTISQFSGAPALSDAMLSRNVDFATYGTTGFLIAWDKTRGNLNIKGLCSIATMQSVLLANRADIKSIRDFRPEDRISVPATVAPQALILRIAAERAYGPGQYSKLDPQMVVLPHPEGLRALLSRSGVVAQVTSPPFDSLALRDQGIHKVLTSDDIFGGPSTFLVLATTEGFARESPKTTKAVLRAVEDAMTFIKDHRMEAAAIYLRSDDAKLDQAFVEKLLADPVNAYEIAPRRILEYVAFLKKTKLMRNSPTNWHELFLPLIADQQGS